VFLPLHIFEPRYREMVADAVASDRMIGMALLRPGWERDYEGRPPVYPIGCSGVITHVERLPDGRYNIVLRGMERFRITGEDHSQSYRLAHIEALPEPATEADRAGIRTRRQRLEAVLAVTIERSGGEPRFPPSVPDDDLVNALAQYLPLEPLERQALLECDGIAARCDGLIELLEMHTLTGGSKSWKDRSVH
jgi:hypothetical protein